MARRSTDKRMMKRWSRPLKSARRPAAHLGKRPGALALQLRHRRLPVALPDLVQQPHEPRVPLPEHLRDTGGQRRGLQTSSACPHGAEHQNVSHMVISQACIACVDFDTSCQAVTLLTHVSHVASSTYSKTNGALGFGQ